MLQTPVIGWGVFDNAARHPVQPGAAPGHYVTGFGILNPPRGFASIVSDDANSPDLHDYLRYALAVHQEELLAYRAATHPNALELLIGLSLKYIEIDSTNVYCETTDRKAFNFKYERVGVDCLIVERSAVSEAINYNNVVVKAVEGNVIELETGLRFALEPRYPREVPDWSGPALDANRAVKIYLTRNLDKRLTPQDS